MKKTWGSLVAEKYDELFYAMPDAYCKAYSNNFGSGWSFDVVLDCDGSVDVFGPRNNSESEREWTGLAKKIYSVENPGDFSWQMAMDWIDPDDKELIDWMKEHEVEEEDDSDWSWTDDEGYGKEHFFKGELPDSLYLKAVEEESDSDQNRESRVAILDFWKSDKYDELRED